MVFRCRAGVWVDLVYVGLGVGLRFKLSVLGVSVAVSFLGCGFSVLWCLLRCWLLCVLWFDGFWLGCDVAV